MGRLRIHKAVPYGALIFAIVATYLVIFFPDWFWVKILGVIAAVVFLYTWLAMVFHVGKLGKKIQKSIVEEDDAYRESLKPIPPWKRPPPDT
jgi:hypothetical protein